MPNTMSNEEVARYVDLDSALERLRGNTNLYKRMLGLFVQSEEFAAFEKAVEDADDIRASDVMHGIKGIAGNLSLTALYEISTILTVDFKKGTADPQMVEDYRGILVNTKICVEDIIAKLN